MKRNVVIALIISVLAMNLPFWQMENRIQLISAIVILWMMSFVILVGTDQERREHR